MLAHAVEVKWEKFVGQALKRIVIGLFINLFTFRHTFLVFCSSFSRRVFMWDFENTFSNLIALLIRKMCSRVVVVTTYAVLAAGKLLVIAFTLGYRLWTKLYSSVSNAFALIQCFKIRNQLLMFVLKHTGSVESRNFDDCYFLIVADLSTPSACF